MTLQSTHSHTLSNQGLYLATGRIFTHCCEDKHTTWPLPLVQEINDLLFWEGTCMLLRGWDHWMWQKCWLEWSSKSQMSTRQKDPYEHAPRTKAGWDIFQPHEEVMQAEIHESGTMPLKKHHSSLALRTLPLCSGSETMLASSCN